MRRRPGQSCPGRGVARVELEHVLEERVGAFEGLCRALPPKLDGLQVERVGLGVGGARRRHLSEKRCLQLLGHLGRDLVLDGEDVVELAVPTPSEKRSLLASTCSPRACSGDM